jgi:oxazoline/thiazoline dehydrogenase
MKRGGPVTQTPLLSFRQDVSVSRTSDDRVTLAFPGHRLTLAGLTPGLLAGLHVLSAGGHTEDAVSAVVLERDGAGALASLYFCLQRCTELGLLCYGVVDGDRSIATVVPMTEGFAPSIHRLESHQLFVLSRFAYCHRDRDALVLESPLSVARTILGGPTGGTVLAELANPRSFLDLGHGPDGLSEDAAELLLRLLASAGLVEEVGESGTTNEGGNPVLAQWAFHDLLFHSRSRPGRHDYPIGGTFPFLGRIPPLPAVKPPMSEQFVALPTPDLTRIAQDEPTLTRVLEVRRSVRGYGDEPITMRELGEFLYRVARVRRVTEADLTRSRHYQTTSRPYPSGGATYDLELYLAIQRCAGISAGMYHYDPLGHRLHALDTPAAQVNALLRDARLAGALSSEPQVLIILASRFQRVSWKYASLAYATTLKNVGVLYQTMYLVATAMSLAPCALGAGDSALFSHTVGASYLQESSVGEFLLGSTMKRRD